MKRFNFKPLADLLTAGVFVAIIYALAAAFIITPDNAKSEDENRVLQQLPALNADSLFSGRFTKQMGDYYADQFPARNAFVGAKTAFSYFVMRQPENKGAFVARDGYIMQRFDIYDDTPNNFDADFTYGETMANLEANLGYISAFASDMASLGVSVTFAAPPRKIDVMTNELPPFFPTGRDDDYLERIRAALSPEIYLPLEDVLRPKSGEYIYYKTDHHWTTLGAYYAYAALGERLGYAPLPADSFTVKQASASFFGTTWSKMGAKWVAPDSIYYYTTPGEDGEYVTEITGGKTLAGFYDTAALETKDKYSSFIGGINALTLIHAADGSPKEKLLLVTDSFGQSLAPFLARHFDLHIMDPRFYSGSVYSYVKDNDIKKVLILQGVESLSTMDAPKRLSLR